MFTYDNSLYTKQKEQLITTTSQNGFKIDQPIHDIEGGSKSPRALNYPVGIRKEKIFDGEILF